MPVPSTIADLSTTPASNSPSGSESPSVMDDYHRSLAAITRTVYDAQQTTNGTLMPKSGGTFTGHIEVPASASGSQAMRASEVSSAISTAITGAGYATETYANTAAANAVTTHSAAADPHTGYMRRVETSMIPASGLAVDITPIPSWVKRITVMYYAITTNGSSIPVFQVGTGGTPATSGYAGCTSGVSSGATALNHTSGSQLYSTSWATTYIANGGITFVLMDSSTNRWAYTQNTGLSNPAASSFSGGTVALGGALDVVRLTTQGGSNTFLTGNLRMIYEG